MHSYTGRLLERCVYAAVSTTPSPQASEPTKVIENTLPKVTVTSVANLHYIKHTLLGTSPGFSCSAQATLGKDVSPAHLLSG